MSALMKIEFSRFRSLAVVLAVVHGLLLGGALTVVDLLSPGLAALAIGVVLYGGIALALGWHQFRSHRTAGLWTCLLHRPLPPRSILLAMLGAGVVSLLLAVTLPLLSTLLLLDLGSARWIEFRHYASIGYLSGLAVSLYLAGAYIALSPGRASALVLVLPAILLIPDTSLGAAFLRLLVVLAYLAYLVQTTFRPTVNEMPRRAPAVIAAALPTHFGLSAALVLAVTLLYSAVATFSPGDDQRAADFTWNDHFREGTFRHTAYLTGAEAIAAGLAADHEAGGPLIPPRELIELAELSPKWRDRPRRHQMIFADDASTFRSGGVDWTFTHTHMLFHGRSAQSGKTAGWLGTSSPAVEAPGAAVPFPAVPRVVDDEWIVAGDHVFRIRPESSSVELCFHEEGARVVAPPVDVDGELAILTTDALHLQSAHGGPRRILLPGAVENLARVHLSAHADGLLVSFLFGQSSERGRSSAHQTIVGLNADGSQNVLSRRPLAFGPPAWYRYRGFLVSPFLQNTYDMIRTSALPGRPDPVRPLDLLLDPPPLMIALVAAALATLAAILTSRRARRTSLGKRTRWCWTGAAFLMGVPLFLSFLLLVDER